MIKKEEENQISKKIKLIKDRVEARRRGRKRSRGRIEEKEEDSFLPEKSTSSCS